MKEFYKSGPEVSRHINHWLADNCFGDYYTRTGLDYAERELITLAGSQAEYSQDEVNEWLDNLGE